MSTEHVLSLLAATISLIVDRPWILLPVAVGVLVCTMLAPPRWRGVLLPRPAACLHHGRAA